MYKRRLLTVALALVALTFAPSAASAQEVQDFHPEVFIPGNDVGNGVPVTPAPVVAPVVVTPPAPAPAPALQPAPVTEPALLPVTEEPAVIQPSVLRQTLPFTGGDGLLPALLLAGGLLAAGWALLLGTRRRVAISGI